MYFKSVEYVIIPFLYYFGVTTKEMFLSEG